MLEHAASHLATSQSGRNARMVGTSERLPYNLQFRAVQIMLAARHGSKLATARALVGELKVRGLKASVRSLYFWRHRLLCIGQIGRRTRSDAGRPRTWLKEIQEQLGSPAMRGDKEFK